MNKKSLYLFGFLLLFSPLSLPAQNSEKAYQKLKGLSGEKRQQALLEGAKREGSLTLYAVFTQPTMEALLKLFNSKYPFIKTQFIREGRGDALAEKYFTELRAGRNLADVVAGGDNAILELIEGKGLARYPSPEQRNYPKDYKDAEGRWTTVFISEWAFGYNTALVDRSKLPKTYMDLLDPYWKGKLGLDPLPNNFVRGALRVFGEKKATDLFQKLVDHQEVQFRRGRTTQTQLLAAGEFAASPELRLSILKELKTKGAPVNYHFAYPFPVTLGAVGVFNAAPHPYASALFTDFWLSKEGQQFMIDREFTVVREGMTEIDPEGKKNMVPLTLEFRKATDDWVRQVTRDIFAKKARGR